MERGRGPTRYEIEQDVEWIAREIAEDNDLESDFYGDCYPDEIMSLENRMELAETQEEYDSLLDRVKEELINCLPLESD